MSESSRYIYPLSSSSVCSNDVYRHESGKCRSLSFTLIYFLSFYHSRFSFYINIMVSGGISRYGKTELHVVPQNRTVDGEYYWQEILSLHQKVMNDPIQFPRCSVGILMQDGATANSAEKTTKVIRRNFNGVWTDWLGNSSDLNVIENLWAKFQDSMFRKPRSPQRTTHCKGKERMGIYWQRNNNDFGREFSKTDFEVPQQQWKWHLMLKITVYHENLYS